MRLHVIGSSGTFPVAGRPASGYLIQQSETRVWCDAGPGTFVGLPVAPDMVDAVVLSHQHPDHCADIFAAFHAWTYRPEPRTGVPLYCPESLWDRISGFLGAYPGYALEQTFIYHPVAGGDRIHLGDLSVAFTDMDHSVPTVGSRWEANGRSLFFTADTGAAGDWRESARDVDVLLSEAAYQGEAGTNPYPHHLTAGEAGAIAREVGAKKLVLTHMPPYLDVSRSVHEAELTYDRPVAVATPGTEINV